MTQRFRIAVGGLHTECATASPLMQQAGDFTRVEGAALIDMAGMNRPDIDAVPIFHDRSLPGGPVDPALFAAQVGEFVTRLKAAGPLDGVLLIMHGAYFVPGVDDPEGEFVTAVRQAVGPQVIISSAWDLHGQITETITAQVDAFAAFRTAPHIDQAETRARALAMLIRALETGVRPKVVRVAIPLLVSGEMSSTFVAPCDALYAALPQMDRRDGVWDANLMIGYLWADSPRATAAAIVTATDEAAGRATAVEIAQSYWNARHALTPDMDSAPLEDLLDRWQGPTILADSGDNPTAGGVGDRADVLAALLARDWDHDTLIAGIAAPHAAKAAISGASSGTSSGAGRLTIGGELGGGGPQVSVTPDHVAVYGDDAVVSLGRIKVVLTARRRPFHTIADFAALDLSPRVGLLVVKSGYLSTELRPLPMAQKMALTQGAVCQDVASLSNRHRPRPTWPFDRGGRPTFLDGPAV